MTNEFQLPELKLPEAYLSISPALKAAVLEELAAFESNHNDTRQTMAHLRVLQKKGEAIFDLTNPADAYCLEAAKLNKDTPLFRQSFNVQMAEDLRGFSSFGAESDELLPISRNLAMLWAAELQPYGPHPTAAQHAAACQVVLTKHGAAAFDPRYPSDVLCLYYAKAYVIGMLYQKVQLV